MDYFLLPEKIKSQLPPPSGSQPLVMNASCGLDGNPGECYLIVFPDSISVFYKKFGPDSFSRLDAASSDPKFSISVMKDKFNSMLEIASSSWSHKLKFSSFDAQKLEGVASSLLAGASSKAASSAATLRPPEAVPQDAAAPSVELDPFVGLLAATMFVAGHDGKIDIAEDNYIKTLAANDSAALTQALKVYKACSSSELAVALSNLDREGRLCVLANMFDVAICDGVLRSSEQQLIFEFAIAMGLSREDGYAIRDVLVLKGRAPFLKSSARAN